MRIKLWAKLGRELSALRGFPHEVHAAGPSAQVGRAAYGPAYETRTLCDLPRSQRETWEGEVTEVTCAECAARLLKKAGDFWPEYSKVRVN